MIFRRCNNGNVRPIYYARYAWNIISFVKSRKIKTKLKCLILRRICENIYINFVSINEFPLGNDIQVLLSFLVIAFDTEVIDLLMAG